MRTTTLTQYSPTGITEMERLERDIKIFSVIALGSFILGILSTIGVIISVWFFGYVMIGLCIGLAAYAYYATPFWYVKKTNLIRTRMMLVAMGEGIDSVEELAERGFVTPEFAITLIERAKAAGYMN